MRYPLIAAQVDVQPGYSAAIVKHTRGNIWFISNRYLAFFLSILIIKTSRRSRSILAFHRNGYTYVTIRRRYYFTLHQRHSSSLCCIPAACTLLTSPACCFYPRSSLVQEKSV